MSATGLLMDEHIIRYVPPVARRGGGAVGANLPWPMAGCQKHPAALADRPPVGCPDAGPADHRMPSAALGLP